MIRITHTLLTAFVLLALPVLAEEDDKDRRRAERRLLNLEVRAKKVTAPTGPADPLVFLQQETRRLLDRCRTYVPSSYEFDRILEAVDDLLDARDDLQASTQDSPDRPNGNREDDDNNQGATAKRLERAYFRVQQAEYFARLSSDKQAPEYIPLSRQLYQRARSAYDAREYRRANKLASASTELVSVLENLAQAAVRKPEPPVLK